jgi:hypothetical protein
MGTNVKLFHNKKKNIIRRDLGTKAYVFTSWGLVKGTIVKYRTDKYSGILQYKLTIDVDKNNKDIDYNFWYTADQMYKYIFGAIVKELLRPVIVKKIK